MLFLTCANVEPPHAKAHSAQTVSRKSALCTRHLTERRSLHQRRHRDVTERRTLDGRRHGKVHSACERWLRREAVFAGLCTPLHTHGRSRDRAGPWAPRHRGAHGPRDARALGPEVHATGAVTQPPTRTHEPGITSSGESGQVRQSSDTRRRDTSRASFRRRLPEHLRPQYHRHAA